MITIRDTNLFNVLIEESKKENGDIWSAQFVIPENEAPYMRNGNIPFFFGGLDHIDVKAKGVYFHDRGCNGKDNTYVIRPEITKED